MPTFATPQAPAATGARPRPAPPAPPMVRPGGPVAATGRPAAPTTTGRDVAGVRTVRGPIAAPLRGPLLAAIQVPAAPVASAAELRAEALTIAGKPGWTAAAPPEKLPPRAEWPERARAADARITDLLGRAKPLVDQALAKLPPAAAADYRALASRLASHPARLALAQALVDGELAKPTGQAMLARWAESAGEGGLGYVCADLVGLAFPDVDFAGGREADYAFTVADLPPGPVTSVAALRGFKARLLSYNLGAEGGYGKIERMAFDADRDTASLKEGASALLERAAGLERDALAKLPADRRAAYGALRTQLADDPRAALGLVELLLDGKLGARPRHGDGPDLLGALGGLAARPLDPALEISNADLLGQVIIEAADPNTITQGMLGMCGTAAVQIMLASTDPATYVRIIGDLASPEGRAPLHSGEALVREGVGPLALRSRSAEMFQTAAQALGTGGRTKLQGINPDELDRLLEALHDRPFQPLEKQDAADLADQVLARVGAGELVEVGLALPRERDGEIKITYHAVAVVGYDAERQLVRIADPNSKVMLVDVARFKELLDVAIFTTPEGPAPLKGPTPSP